MQVVPLIEGRTRRVEVDHRAAQPLIRSSPELHPSAPPGRDDLVKAGNRPGEAGRDEAPHLAAAAVQRKAGGTLDVVKEEPEELAARTARRGEIPAKSIDHHHRLIAVGRREEAVEGESARQLVVAQSIERQRCGRLIGIAGDVAGRRDREGWQTSAVSTLELDVFTSDQVVEPDRTARLIGGDRHEVPGDLRVEITRLKADRLVGSQSGKAIGYRTALPINEEEMDGIEEMKAFSGRHH